MDAGSFLNIAKAIVMIFGGCMSNVYTLEVLTREDKGCGNLVTFSHMVAISCFAAIENFNWSTFQFKARKIGIQYYMRLVVMFFVVQIANNKAFAFNISLPLHLVFRSGSLMASMLVGAFYLNRRYTRNSVLGVTMVTGGIFVATYASNPTSAVDGKDPLQEQDWTHFIEWCIGISMLIFALVMSAFLGALQEHTYEELGVKKSDVPWQENLFYTHLLSIPVFVILTSDISLHISVFNQCSPMWLPLVGEMPQSWVYLLLNVITQYVCIRGVYMMVCITDALTCTLVLSIRKIMSLVLSIHVFEHPFTQLHICGVCLVVAGTVLYTKEQLLLKAKDKS